MNELQTWTQTVWVSIHELSFDFFLGNRFGKKMWKLKKKSNLIKSDQIWSNLIKSDQNHYFIRFDKIWSDLIRFDQVDFF